MSVDPATGLGRGLSAEQHELLRLLLEEEEGITLDERSAIPKRADTGPAPLSFAQQRLWFLHQMEPDSPAYNVPLALRLTGELDLPTLAAALGEVVRRHEVLRTTFAETAGQPVQVVHPPMPLIPLPVVDLGGLPEAAREAALPGCVEAELRRPFDLAAGPLLRALAVRLGPSEHAVAVNLHHIVADGWSMGVFLREIEALFVTTLSRRPSTLPALPFQYADFAAWQRGWLTGDRLERQLAFWRERLADPPVLQLPADHPRPAVPSSRGIRLARPVPERLAAGLRGLGRRHEASLFMTLLAAFAAFLHRLTRQDDLTVGSPIANRRPVETEALIGYFANTLVLRADAGRDPSFAEMLARVRTATLAAYDHPDVPFELLVEELQPARDLGRTPLFQAVLALQNAFDAAVRLPGLRTAPLAARTGTAKFELTLFGQETGDDLSLGFEAHLDLFEAPTVERMLDQLAALLEGVVADDLLRLSDLPLLGDAEREQVLAWSRATATDFSVRCLHHGFEAQAARRPGAAAVAFEDAVLTYGELDRRANRLARRLLVLGAGPEVRVGICLDRSLDTVVAILATLKSGSAYVPLDPGYPQERLAFLLADAAPAVLLTDRALLDSLPPHGAAVLLVDEAAADGDDSPLNIAAEPGNAAYVIYTSGSTGKPKGVVVTHAQAARLFTATETWFGFGEDDVWTLFHSYAFDFSVWEIWGALLHGGRLVVVPYLVSRSPEAFWDLVVRNGVTVLNQTPSAFRQVSRAALASLASLASDTATPALRWIVFGGEALDPQSLASWFDRFGDARPTLVNMYGITETTVHVTFRPLTRTDAGSPRGSIGRAIPDLDLHVLGPGLQPLPVGVPGELHVGGAGLARGYLNRPELTAQRFIPSPWSERGGGRLYRTGDLGRYRPDGEVEYLGRIDAQVKLRGFRIELGEIEAALAAQPAVGEAVVLLREDVPGEPRLVGYVVPRDSRDGAALSPAELRTALQRQLPEPLVPAALVVLPELPRTAHGKLDRRALPEPQAARREAGDGYVAPRSEAEEILAGIWSHVLGVERVGAHDRFFALGGDSIRSVRVIALARQRGLDLSLPQLFQHQTIAELTAALAAQRPAVQAPTAPFSLISAEDRALVPADVEDAYPLTRLQAGMLFHMQAGGAVPLYHNVDTAHLRGALDSAAFQAAVQEVVARHAILRTGFALSGWSEPLQLVHRTAFLPVPVTDLSAVSAGEQDEEIAGFVAAERRNLFDLARPPLIRFHIHRRGPDSFQLTLTECHAIFDGWSLHSTLNEIFERAFAHQDGRPLPPAPPPAVAFREYVALERAALASPEVQAFWEERLADVEPTLLPRWPAGGADAPARLHHSLEIQPEIHAGLRRLEREAALPFKSLVLAVHLKALSLLAGRSEVTTGVVLHGRPEELGGEDVRGLFLNTVPVRFAVSSGSWRDLVAATFDAERDLLPYRRYPLATLQASRPGVTLFEAAFNYVHFHVVEGLLGSGRLQVVDFRGYEDTNFLLVAHFRISLADGRPFLTLEADAACLPPAQVESLGRLYARALASLAADPDAPHAALSPFDPQEEAQVLGAWAERRDPDLAETSIAARFAAVAAERPAAVAVCHGSERLTYAELDRASNQLARRLRALGVGPEVPVALILERSIGLVTAVLAVLKAGGFYVPLDPRDPLERRTGILSGLDGAGGEGPPPVLITHHVHWEELPAPRPRAVLLDREREALEALPAGPLPPAGGLDNAAYAIHTSGSTGRPKGVVITHRNVLRLLRATEPWFGFGPDDVWPLFHSYAFDVSVWEIWSALLYGGRLVVVPFLTSRTPDAFGDLLRRERVTVLNQTPSAFLPLIQAESRRDDGDELALKWVVFAGEALDLTSLAPWWRLRGERPPRLVNMYGITETTVHVTWREIAPGETAAGAGSPIGVAIPDLQVYVVNSRLEPVPLGVPGEALVGGAGLARGYLHRPDLTAQRFVPHPFSDRPGDRLYRSGDLVRWKPDGRLEAFGRIDHQVKVRGHRIELGEIEAALSRHPAVRGCVVLARKEGAETRLAAYVTGDPAAPPRIDDLRRHLRSCLPDPMVPAHFAVLDAFPLTRNGKVDRAALAALTLDKRATEIPFVAPRSEIERHLAEVWRGVLRLDRVGVQDNFFDLGGSSITLLQVHHRLQEILRRQVPITLVMAKTTIGDLARALAEPAAASNPGEPNEADDRARQRRERMGPRRPRGGS
jgi:amino acid adenylation domain-containing protein